VTDAGEGGDTVDGPVLVTGANGFVGRRVVQALVASGRPVRAMVRNPGSYSGTGAGVEVVAGDLTDPASLRRAVDGAAAVISTAAVTGARKPPPGGYDRVNVQGIADLATAATAARVDRVVHFGGIDRVEGRPGPYLAGRRRGEDALRAAGVPWTILQPSVQFGPGSEFIKAMAGLARLPVVPVAGDGSMRIQLVHVDDVARCALDCLQGSARLGREIEIGGPEALTYDDILDVIGSAHGRRSVPKLHAPLRLVGVQARLLQVLPRPPVTPAALELLAEDNVALSLEVVEREFGFRPRGFREHVAAHGLELG
jgi:NADH dehydrogenase